MCEEEKTGDIEMLDEYDFSNGVRGIYTDRFTNENEENGDTEDVANGDE